MTSSNISKAIVFARTKDVKAECPQVGEGWTRKWRHCGEKKLLSSFTEMFDSMDPINVSVCEFLIICCYIYNLIHIQIIIQNKVKIQIEKKKETRQKLDVEAWLPPLQHVQSLLPDPEFHVSPRPSTHFLAKEQVDPMMTEANSHSFPSGGMQSFWCRGKFNSHPVKVRLHLESKQPATSCHLALHSLLYKVKTETVCISHASPQPFLLLLVCPPGRRPTGSQIIKGLSVT